MKRVYLIGLLFSSLICRAATEPVQGSQIIEEGANLDVNKLMDLRDPFRRLISTATGVNIDNEKIPELFKYNTEQFILIGVIIGTKTNKAILKTPDGKIQIVKERMGMGTRKGIVRRITSSKILVEEKVTNILGKEEVVENIIELKGKPKL